MAAKHLCPPANLRSLASLPFALNPSKRLLAGHRGFSLHLVAPGMARSLASPHLGLQGQQDLAQLAALRSLGQDRLLRRLAGAGAGHVARIGP